MRETLIRTCGVEKRHVFTHDTAQMRLIDDEEFVQAFFAHRSNPAFHVGVRIRGTIGCRDHVNAFRAKNGVKRLTEFLIVIRCRQLGEPPRSGAGRIPCRARILAIVSRLSL